MFWKRWYVVFQFFTLYRNTIHFKRIKNPVAPFCHP